MNERAAVRACLAIAVGLACLALAARPAGAAGPIQPPPGLTPWPMTAQQDSQGFLWDFEHQGTIIDGTNDCFDGGLTLMVNGQPFMPTQVPMMDQNTQEIWITGQSGMLQVTRRIWVDVQGGCVRYLEMLTNASGAPQPAMLLLETQLGGPCQMMTTNTGNFQPATLGPQEEGVVALQMGGRPSVAWFLASDSSPVKPQVQNNSNIIFDFIYNVNVPAGETVIIAHGIAQRHLAGQPDPTVLAQTFQPFTQPSWLAGLDAETRRAIVNVSSRGWGAGVMPSLLERLEQLGVARGHTDTLALGEGTVLTGSAACPRLEMSVDLGEIAVPLDRVAAVTGRRYDSKQSHLFLRDGQVFRGRLAPAKLRFVTGAGAELVLNLADIDRLVLRQDPADGQPAAETVAYVNTRAGSRLALTGEPPIRFEAVTPWGERSFDLAEIQRLMPAGQDAPFGYQVELKDSSRFFTLLSGENITVGTLNFGPRQFNPTEIISLIAAERVTDRENDPFYTDFATAAAGCHVVLTGENVFLGTIDAPVVRFLVQGQVIPVPPNQIHRLQLTPNPLGGQGGPCFAGEIWGSGVVTGELLDTVLPVRTGDLVLQVPTSDLVEAVVPSPVVSERLGGRIARLVQDLGHPDWQQRDQAAAELEELGHLARPQLEEAVRNAGDPEIRRRARLLLESIGD